MALAFGVLRLSPENFWAMTPRELAHAVSALPGRRRPSAGAAPDRGALAALMRAFPDFVSSEEAGHG